MVSGFFPDFFHIFFLLFLLCKPIYLHARHTQREWSKKVRTHGPKKFWGIRALFRRRGYLRPKINIPYRFYHKFDAKYFHVKNFFGKSVFSGETTKNCSGGTHWGVSTNFWPTLYQIYIHINTID